MNLAVNLLSSSLIDNFYSTIPLFLVVIVSIYSFSIQAILQRLTIIIKQAFKTVKH